MSYVFLGIFGSGGESRERLRWPAVWGKMIVLDTRFWKKGAWWRRKKVPLVISVLVLPFGQEGGAWYLVFKGGAYGGLGDGCLRWLLFRGFRREDQVLKKDSGSVFRYELLMFRCSRTCQRPESMLLYRSGLFRPLRSPASEGTLVCSRVFFWS